MSNQLKKTLRWLALGMTLSLTLQACPLVILGSAVSGIAVVANDRRTVGAQTDDRNIQLRANSYLKKDLPTTAHIEVTAYNRRVLLVGQVTNINDKIYAEKIVRSIDNVRDIINEIEISPIISESKQSKDIITTGKVKAAFLADKQISSNYYKVVTVAGVVYLMGLVSQTEGDYATELASRIDGVSKVVRVFEYIEEKSNELRQRLPQNNPKEKNLLPDQSENVSGKNIKDSAIEQKSKPVNDNRHSNNFSNLKIETLD